MNPFSFATTAQILCESGSASQLGELCKVRDAHRVLIVTDPGITKIGLLSGVLPTLSSAGIAVEVFDQVEADPPESVVLAAVEQAKAMQAELIIGFGGGSSMDVAKLVALLAHPSCTQTLQDIYGVGNARGQRLPATYAAPPPADHPIGVDRADRVVALLLLRNDGLQAAGDRGLQHRLREAPAAPARDPAGAG